MDSAIPRRSMTSVMALLAMLCASGCSYLGYQKFRPREINEYDDMVVDPAYPGGRGGPEGWIWVRGRVSGDVDGDRQDEEVVISTLQGGDAGNPSPCRRALLLICRRDQKHGIRLLLRRNIYEAGRTLNEEGLPQGVHLPRPADEMRHCSVRIFDIDSSGCGIILVSFWSAPENGLVSAWHAAFRFTAGGESAARLDKIFGALAIQDNAAVEAADFDRDMVDELVVRQRVLAPAQLAGGGDLDPPEWISIYAMAADGKYRQKDGAFAEPYAAILLPWYASYVQLMHSGGAPALLAPMEYYIGQMHRFLKQTEVARVLLESANRNAADARLRDLVRDALGACAASPAAEGGDTDSPPTANP